MRTERAKLKLGWGRIAICILLLLLAGVLALFFRHVTGMLPSQQAAGRWGGDAGRFAQVTVFLPQHNGLTQGEVNGLISALWRELQQEGLEPETPAGAPIFAYSAEGVLEGVASQYRGPIDVYATGVGGNFFLFHPVQLISGVYFPPEGFNQDLVLIDERMAWQLFGAIDVAGLELLIGGRSFLISGVYRPLSDFASRAAYGEMPHMFLYYSAMVALSGWSPITTMEAVLPNPISGLAEEMLREAIESAGVEEGEFILLNNTDRYGPLALFGVLREFGQRSMYRTGLRLPYWENAARMAEDFAALALALILLLLVYPLILALRVLLDRWRRRKRRLKMARKKLEDIREKRREAEWKSAHPSQDEVQQYDVDEIIRLVRESEDNDENEKEN